MGRDRDAEGGKEEGREIKGRDGGGNGRDGTWHGTGGERERRKGRERERISIPGAATGRPTCKCALSIQSLEKKQVELCIANEVVRPAVTIRPRFDGRSTAYQRSLRSQ